MSVARRSGEGKEGLPLGGEELKGLCDDGFEVEK